MIGRAEGGRRHRKYYGLNDTGRDHLEEGTKTWRSFTDTLDKLLEGATK